jgi:hypothetical protein
MKNLYEGLNMAQRKNLDRELKIRAQPKMWKPMAPGRRHRAEMQRLALAKALRIGATI